MLRRRCAKQFPHRAAHVIRAVFKRQVFGQKKWPADAHNKTGTDAINRYAMPSDEPAIYVFTVKPTEKTEIRRGTVEPAYGKPGGGVEVIFVNGSSEKTVTGPDTIPAK